MLEKLTVKNFQAHKLAVIELDPAITTIVGSNDVGKTAIIRALMWACLNDPAGLDFLRRGKSKVTVTLQVDRNPGHTISRSKSKQSNSYSMDGVRWSAFGNNVPPDIEAMLNVSELNFQQQLEPHFWFSDSPGQISRNMNAIIDLSIIDTALARASAASRKAKTVIEVTRDRLREAKVEKAKLAYVRPLNNDLMDVELAENEWRYNSKKCGRLRTLLQNVQCAAENTATASDVASAASKLVRMAGKCSKLTTQINSLHTACVEIITVKNAREADLALAKIEEEKLASVKECPLCQQPM